MSTGNEASGSYFVQSKRSLLLVKQSFTLTYLAGLYHHSILSGFFLLLPKIECTKDFWLQHSRNVSSLQKAFTTAVPSLFRSRVVSNAAARAGVTQCWGALRDSGPDGCEGD